MTITDQEAFTMMKAHHHQLSEELTQRVSALHDAVAAGHPYELARAQLVSYLVDQVLSHAGAEERSIYREAAAIPELAARVAAMTREHRELAATTEMLAHATNGPDAVTLAHAVGALFGPHVATENEVLLPALVASESVALGDLLDQMHSLTELDHEEPTDDNPQSDHEAIVLAQLLSAATELARAGQGEQACSLVAATWATLRGPRPDLANRVNLALHRLVRLASQEPVALRPTRQSPSDPVLDVRTMAPAQRHETIFATFLALGVGEALVLVNDHDPKPLRYQFDAEYAGDFTWDYLESGPRVWRVRIARVAAHAAPARS